MRPSALVAAATLLLIGCSGPAPAPAGNDTVSDGTGAAANATAAPDVTPAAPPAANALAPDPSVLATRTRGDYLGRWRGVEGLNLVVTPRTGSDAAVMLAMQWSLDDKGRYDGAVTPQGIRFERNGAQKLLRPSDGAGTGLKYLDGKADCLTVKPGEGYCRD